MFEFMPEFSLKTGGMWYKGLVEIRHNMGRAGKRAMEVYCLIADLGA